MAKKKRRNKNHLSRASKQDGARYSFTKKRHPVREFLKRIFKSFR